MGIFWSMFKKTPELRSIMLGLDSAGKTTLLYKMRLGEIVRTIPTIGFNVESVEHKNRKITVWDVGGQDKIRRLWKHYFKNTQVLIYVVDSVDTNRFNESRDVLHKILEEPELRQAIVLIYANKQDMIPMAHDITEIADALELYRIKNNWKIQACSAIKGDGLYEGFDWIISKI